MPGTLIPRPGESRKTRRAVTLRPKPGLRLHLEGRSAAAWLPATPGSDTLTFRVRFPDRRPLLGVVPPPPETLAPSAEPLHAPAPGDDTAALLRRYATTRDEQAFAEIVRRHLDLVYSAALRQLAGNHPQAEDVTQAVFTELARHAARLDRHPTLAGWLLTTTRQMARSASRTDRRRQQREHQSGLHEPVSIPHESAVEDSDWSRIGPVLDDVLHQLSERDRNAVVLRFLESRPFVDIGRALGTTPNAARMRVDRALDRLRQRLARHGITSTSTALATAITANAVHAAPAGLSAGIAATALTAASATLVPTAGTSLIPVMLSLKSKLVLGGIAASLLAVPFALQHAELRRLRRELSDEQTARQTLAQSEAEARRAAELAAAENARLQESRNELLRLRGEIGPLRDQVRALGRATAPIRAPNSAPSAAPAPEANPRATELSDLGAATAEHAAGSLIWAVAKGRVDRLSELLELPAGVGDADASRHYRFFANQLNEVFREKDFNGWKLDLRGTTNEDIVRLHFGYRDLATGGDDAFTFQLHRHDTGWKVMVEGEVPEGF